MPVGENRPKINLRVHLRVHLRKKTLILNKDQRLLLEAEFGIRRIEGNCVKVPRDGGKPTRIKSLRVGEDTMPKEDL